MLKLKKMLKLTSTLKASNIFHAECKTKDNVMHQNTLQ